MVQNISTYLFLLLLTISPVHVQAFSLCANYILTRPFYDSSTVSFPSQNFDSAIVQTKASNANTGLPDTTVKPLVACASTNVASLSWFFYGAYAACENYSEFGLGIWINFASTKYVTSSIMNIGSSYGYPNTYSISSSTEGVLSFVYRGRSYSSYNNINDFDVNVPRNEWILLIMYWASDGSLKVYVPGQAPTIKSGTSPSFTKFPAGGSFWFGRGVTASIYQIIGFKSVTISTDNTIITLTDNGSSTKAATTVCDVACTDHICHPTQKCMASTMDCNDCDTNVLTCKTCATSGRVAADFAICLFVLIIVLNVHQLLYALNVAQGFTFMIMVDQQLVLVIFYVDCATSCTACNPSPTCYSCADSIEEDGVACRVDKIGFQMSFSGVNLIIDFAHPLVSAVTLKTITAQTSAGSPIPTTNWKLNTCAANSVTCTIVTDNVSESQLPIDFDFEFSKA